MSDQDFYSIKEILKETREETKQSLDNLNNKIDNYMVSCEEKSRELDRKTDRIEQESQLKFKEIKYWIIGTMILSGLALGIRHIDKILTFMKIIFN